MKITVKLSDGTDATNLWLWANAHRMASVDVEMILNTPRFDRLAKAMLAGFAESLRVCYRRRWAATLGKPIRMWKDQPQALRAFEAAARVWAEEYARRGMTVDKFLDAAQELRPKSVKFPTPQMIGGPALGEAIRNWIPREERQTDASWSAHEDSDGLCWINNNDGQGPILLVNSPAAREALLKSAKVS